MIALWLDDSNKPRKRRVAGHDARVLYGARIDLNEVAVDGGQDRPRGPVVASDRREERVRFDAQAAPFLLPTRLDYGQIQPTKRTVRNLSDGAPVLQRGVGGCDADDAEAVGVEMTYWSVHADAPAAAAADSDSKNAAAAVVDAPPPRPPLRLKNSSV